MKGRVVWHTPEPGSAAARYARELITALTAQGQPVTLVCPQNYQFRVELLKNPLVTLKFTPFRSTDTTRGFAAKLANNLSFVFRSAFILLKTLRRGDVLHFQHVLYFPVSTLFFAAALLRGCRIVFTVHDPVPHKWLLPKWLRWVDRNSLLWAYKISDTLIVHSEPGKRALIEHFKLSPANIAIIPRGPYGLGVGVITMPDSEFIEVLHFGSIRENKGIHLAIEAVQALHRQGVKIRLTIAGDVLNGNEAAYWERCSELIAQNPEPIIVSKGFIPDERLPELFAKCHCILLPYTKFFSDSGVAYMALANGRPIVATRAGGLGPLLDSSGVGVAIEEPTTAGVMAALNDVVRLGVPELARQALVGADYVHNQCGWPTVARKTCEVYSQNQANADLPLAGIHLERP